MLFALSKLLGFLIAPSNAVAVLALLGLGLWSVGRKRAGRGLLIAALALVVAFGVLPAGTALMLALEQRFPPWAGGGAPPDGIVVLGGSIDPEASAARGAVVISRAAERVTEAVALARRFPAARVVLVGGNDNVLVEGPPESVYAKPLFESLGVAPARLTIETRSRNTAENARFAAALIAPKPGERWLLVTSAAHMPRAVGSFRKAGFAVEAYPVGWRTKGPRDLWSLNPSPVAGLIASDAAVKEWVGLLAYWLAGRSSALFPGPRP